MTGLAAFVVQEALEEILHVCRSDSLIPISTVPPMTPRLFRLVFCGRGNHHAARSRNNGPFASANFVKNPKIQPQDRSSFLSMEVRRGSSRSKTLFFFPATMDALGLSDTDTANGAGTIHGIIFQKICEIVDISQIVYRDNINFLTCLRNPKERSPDSPKSIDRNTDFLFCQTCMFSDS